MEDKKCIICGKTHLEIPLTQFDYKQTNFWICPQHIPVLIHEPNKMADLLPGADQFEAV